MTTIALPLPSGHRTLIDLEDVPLVEGLTLYRGSEGYVYYSWQRNGERVTNTLHAFLMKAPKGLQVDHINGDRLDNRRENLRVVTVSVNQFNRKHLNRNNRSGVRGVGYQDGKWRARINVNGEDHYLGRFDTVEEATKARRQAEVEFYGEEAPR
jgi:hypothetical protein